MPDKNIKNNSIIFLNNNESDITSSFISEISEKYIENNSNLFSINNESYIVSLYFSEKYNNYKENISDIFSINNESYNNANFTSEISDITMENDRYMLMINNFNDYFKEIINSKNALNDLVDIISSIKNELKERNFDKYISNVIEIENKDIIIEVNNFLYQLTSLDNQNKNQNQNNNKTTINLGECETKLN